MIKEEVNSSIDLEGSSALTKERKDNIREEEAQKFSVSGTVKREKARSSKRVSKKPYRWGHNVIVTKIEEASSAENVSLSSVFEIQNPNLK